MSDKKQVPIMINLPEAYRDQLRVMAAEQNLNNPKQVTSASTIAKEIVCEVLDKASHTKNQEKM